MYAASVRAAVEGIGRVPESGGVSEAGGVLSMGTRVGTPICPRGTERVPCLPVEGSDEVEGAGYDAVVPEGRCSVCAAIPSGAVK